MRRMLEACAFVCLFLFAAQVLESEQPPGNDGTQYIISRLEFQGNRSIERGTILEHVVSRPGDTYNAEAVQRDAQAVRDMGYFDQVRLSVEDDPSQPNGKIVIFHFVERPVIRRIQYRGITSITEADIRKGFEDNKINLSAESPFDQTMLARAATVIEGLLSTHGHPSATVEPTYERVAGTNSVFIEFNVDEGPTAH
jgi:outer membrane protein insertion porin family